MKTQNQRKYKVIGLMSGTSLDGVDIAFCKLTRKKNKWEFTIAASQTIRYSYDWKKKLSSAHLLSGESLLPLHAHYGKFLGQLCNQFIRQNKIKSVDLIAAHGHTIFHQPKNKFTFQLGDGNALHAATGLPVAWDFRSLDVALGGEGAPLVPIGDQLLFHEFGACLNLGGIANISMDQRSHRKAFDICFCNMALNFLATKTGKDFDRSGQMARKGSVHTVLLSSIEKIYRQVRKKRPSLSRESFEKDFQVLLNDESIPLSDRLRTVCESIADEIARSIPSTNKRMKLLATGGGALNSFLIELMAGKLSSQAKIIVPSKKIIHFKEALIFALLGILCKRNETNVLKSVTGASRDSCSGVLIG